MKYETQWGLRPLDIYLALCRGWHSILNTCLLSKDSNNNNNNNKHHVHSVNLRVKVKMKSLSLV